MYDDVSRDLRCALGGMAMIGPLKDDDEKTVKEFEALQQRALELSRDWRKFAGHNVSQ
jgi:hypothetical protein